MHKQNTGASKKKQGNEIEKGAYIQHNVASRGILQGSKIEEQGHIKNKSNLHDPTSMESTRMDTYNSKKSKSVHNENTCIGVKK